MNAEEPPPSSSVRSDRADAQPAGLFGNPPAPISQSDRDRRMIEARLLRMENYLGFRLLAESEAESILSGGTPAVAKEAPVEGGGELEVQIGEYWLARVGVLALSVGLAFLVAFPFAGLPSFVSCLIGYAAAAAFFAASRRWRQARPDTSQILYGGALFLLFFATLRLHFFSAQPVVSATLLGLGLLVAVLAVELVVAEKMGSELMTGLVFGLGMAAVAIADVAWFQFGLLVALAVAALLLVRIRNWPVLGIVVTGLVYLLHLDWLLNNPMLGHPLQGVAAPQGNMVALAAYTIPLVAAGFRPGAVKDHVALRIGRALLICGGTMLVSLINVQLFYAASQPWVESIVGSGLLLAAVAYWRHHQSVYATSIYACSGYMMLSLAIFRHFPAPDFYAWLAWQSLLVVVTAVWFRSKIVIVANLFIFGGIYIAYLLFGVATGPINLSFAVVALLTARLLNWKKDTLDLRTELMRNLYLGAACVVIPYGLYHTVPSAWVSTSWLGVAIAYLVVSAVLHNRKYRVMGIGTILATVIYVFVVDLARLEPAYRIISFLVLGVVLLGVSVAYTKRRRSAPEPDKE